MNLANFILLCFVIGLLLGFICRFAKFEEKVLSERDNAISELNAIRTEREWKKLEL